MRDDIGSRVRVMTRAGHVLEGTLLAAWRLNAGGWAVSLQCNEGLRHATTRERIVGLDAAPTGERTPRADAANSA